MKLKPSQNPLFEPDRTQPMDLVFKCQDLKAPWSHSGYVPDSREIRKVLRTETAREALGQLYRRCAIFGITKGQFSLIELITAILEQTGPAHLALSTWTAAGSDLDDAFKLIESGQLLSVRFLVDHTFQRRKPAFAHRIRQLFGLDAVRVTRNHAKFSLIRNEQWNIVLKTSMNLNFNPRLEDFDVQDDPALADFLEGLLDEIFGKVKKEAIDDEIMVNERQFEKL